MSNVIVASGGDLPDDEMGPQNKHHANANWCGAAIAGIAGLWSRNAALATDEASKGGDALVKALARKSGLGQAQQAGHAAEYLLATNYNVDAANCGSQSRANVLANNGPADIVVEGPNMPAEHVQVKFCSRPETNAYALANTKYDGMQRVGPKGQIEGIREVARRRAMAEPNQGRNYDDVARNAKEGIEYDGAKGRGVSKREAIEAAKHPERVAGKILFKEAAKEAGKAGVIGAVVGGAIAGLVAIVHNIRPESRGQKTWKEALADVLKKAGGGAVKGGVVGLFGSALRVLAVKVGGNILKKAAGGIYAAVGGAVETAIIWVKYCKGRYTLKQALENQTRVIGGVVTVAVAVPLLSMLPLAGALGVIVVGLGTVVAALMGDWLAKLGFDQMEGWHKQGVFTQRWWGTRIQSGIEGVQSVWAKLFLRANFGT